MRLAVEGADAYLQRVGEQMESDYPQAGIRVTWSVLTQPDVASVRMRLAETGAGNAEPHTPASFDLVAMATHGRTGLARWALGSITARVCSSIRVPLLIVQPTDIAQQQLPTDVREHVATAAPSER